MDCSIAGCGVERLADLYSLINLGDFVVIPSEHIKKLKQEEKIGRFS